MKPFVGARVVHKQYHYIVTTVGEESFTCYLVDSVMGDYPNATFSNRTFLDTGESLDQQQIIKDFYGE